MLIEICPFADAFGYAILGFFLGVLAGCTIFRDEPRSTSIWSPKRGRDSH